MRIIFRKLNLKENKYLLAIAYGAIYSLLFFGLLAISSVYLKQFNLMSSVLFSLGIWLLMFVVYLIKWEIFKSGKKFLK